MPLTKPRILYVDENAEDSFTLATLLQLADYEPVTTNFASDALQIARMDEFDLYILSRRFPVDSGAYLCQKLNKISPQTPIIFLTNDGGRNGEVTSGAPEYVAGSRNGREILSAVRLALSLKRGVTSL
ncbi:MAG TPA: response regulator [Pyrinomonadaceae bacterium]|nr:response regulator [Pyrinomonadaceae bacterium]